MAGWHLYCSRSDSSGKHLVCCLFDITKVKYLPRLQFVAMPLGQGYTIEEQLTGQAKQGGIQIDVFSAFSSSVTFFNDRGLPLDLTLSPQQLGIVSGKYIDMHIKCFHSLHSIRVSHGTDFSSARSQPIVSL